MRNTYGFCITMNKACRTVDAIRRLHSLTMGQGRLPLNECNRDFSPTTRLRYTPDRLVALINIFSIGSLKNARRDVQRRPGRCSHVDIDRGFFRALSHSRGW